MAIVPNDIIVLDISTLGLANIESEEEVREATFAGGCIYSYIQDSYIEFSADKVSQFINYIHHAETVVGHSLLYFDYMVLKQYGLLHNQELISKTVDLWKETRMKLDTLAKYNFKATKLINSHISPLRRCTADVQLTVELYELWQNNKLNHRYREIYKKDK